MRRSQAQWERHCTDGLPADIARAVLADAGSLYGTVEPASSSPWYRMNQRLAAHRRAFRATRLHRAYDPQAIRDYANNAANAARRIEPASNRLPDQMRALERRQRFAEAQGIEPPAGRNYSIQGRLRRLETPKWWRRQFRKVWTRDSEGRCRHIGLVRKGRQCYVTDAAVRHHTLMGTMCALFMRDHEVVNDEDLRLQLLQVAEHSLANMDLRRGELMTRARGFEEVALALGHAALFVTLTAPSAFHPQLAAGGANPRYEGYSAREAQQWLSRMWARTRARLKRQKVLVYGFRMAEPHHDGTPHWHVLLHGKPESLAKARAAIERYWFSQYADEPGAAEHRVTCETIDPQKGSAVGYIAKYISKNIDGVGAIGDAQDLESGTDIRTNCRRVRAWASLHGIRQFQQIGGPPVGIWRECRRLREGVRDLDIRAVVEAADRGDWARFVFNVGGIHVGRRTNIRLKKYDTDTTNTYGEEAPARIIGLQYGFAVEITRQHAWRIQKCRPSLSLPVPPPPVPPWVAGSATPTDSSVDGPHTLQLCELARLSASVNPPPPPLSDSESEREYFSADFSASVPAAPSHLGPVAITVRDRRFPALRVYRWKGPWLTQQWLPAREDPPEDPPEDPDG